MLHHILQPDIISHSTSIPWLPWSAATAALRRIGHVALQPNVVTLGNPAGQNSWNWPLLVGECLMLFEDCGDFIFGKIVGDVCKSSYSIWWPTQQMGINLYFHGHGSKFDLAQWWTSETSCDFLLLDGSPAVYRFQITTGQNWRLPKKVATDARHGTSHALGRSRSLFSHRWSHVTWWVLIMRRSHVWVCILYNIIYIYKYIMFCTCTYTYTYIYIIIILYYKILYFTILY